MATRPTDSRLARASGDKRSNTTPGDDLTMSDAPPPDDEMCNPCKFFEKAACTPGPNGGLPCRECITGRREHRCKLDVTKAPPITGTGMASALQNSGASSSSTTAPAANPSSDTSEDPATTSHDLTMSDAPAAGNASSSEASVKRFCICNGPESGDMVACSNEHCAKKWFHFGCVGLRKAPPKKASWFCPDCEKEAIAGVDLSDDPPSSEEEQRTNRKRGSAKKRVQDSLNSGDSTVVKPERKKTKKTAKLGIGTDTFRLRDVMPDQHQPVSSVPAVFDKLSKDMKSLVTAMETDPSARLVDRHKLYSPDSKLATFNLFKNRYYALVKQHLSQLSALYRMPLSSVPEILGELDEDQQKLVFFREVKQLPWDDVKKRMNHPGPETSLSSKYAVLKKKYGAKLLAPVERAEAAEPLDSARSEWKLSDDLRLGDLEEDSTSDSGDLEEASTSNSGNAHPKSARVFDRLRDAALLTTEPGVYDKLSDHDKLLATLIEKDKLRARETGKRLSPKAPISRQNVEQAYLRLLYEHVRLSCIRFRELVALATARRDALNAEDEVRRTNGENVADRDFAGHTYHDLPTSVLRHMASHRGLALDTATYADVVDALHEADANEGRPPADESAVDPSHTLRSRTDALNLAISSRERMAKLPGGPTDTSAVLGDGYAAMSHDRLLSILGTRIADMRGNNIGYGLMPSIARSTPRWKKEALLRFWDAREGIDPAPSSVGVGRFQNMSLQELMDESRTMKAPPAIYNHKNKATVVAWLQDHGASAAVTHKLTLADAQAITEALMPSFLDSMAFLRNDLPVSNTLNVSHTDIAQSHNRGLVAPTAVFRSLEHAIARNLLPTHTSNTGYLCGPRAVETSLHALRRITHDRLVGEAQDSGVSYDFRLERITADDMMRSMFSDYDEDAANDPSDPPDVNVQGTPTQAFRDFLQQRLQDFGLTTGDERYQEEWDELTASNNFSITQLQIMLDFLEHIGVLAEQYSLGVVTAGNGRTPAAVQIVGRIDEDVPVIWLYNDNAAQLSRRQIGYGPNLEALSHWTGFEQFGDRPELVEQWGLAPPDDIDMPRRKAAGKKANTAAELEKRARANANKRRNKVLKGCWGCQGADLTGCDGKPGTACTKCRELGLPCEFPEWRGTHTPFRVANKLVESEQLRWDRPLIAGDIAIIRRCLELGVATPLPKVDTEHFLTIICMRFSSTPPPAYLNFILALVPLFHQRYNNFLGNHNYVHNALYAGHEEARRPGPAGSHLHMRSYGWIHTAHGTLSVPTQLTNNLGDPRTIGLVNLFHHITNPANVNRPYGIDFLTNGIAGARVDIHAFGTRNGGFFQYVLLKDQQNNTNMASRIRITTLADPHVINGQHPHSLVQGAVAPGWVFYQGKYMHCNNLEELIDRNTALEWTALTNTMRAAQGQPPIAVPPGPISPAHDARLDAHLSALNDEWRMRAHHLDHTTSPTFQEAKNRNFNRNRTWM
ncbi:hypothetical protein LTR17_017685 [Elasticomyces elasticus]|nr:hypothetical protein LTR17_017685 [Elasticomyces elasticus]